MKEKKMEKIERQPQGGLHKTTAGIQAQGISSLL